MPTTIKLKNSVTTTNAPSSLAQGEVAINITDKKVWVGNAATTPIQLLGAGASGTFGALTCTSLTNSGLTSGRVTYASTGGLLADSANLTFNGTTLTANTIGAFTLGGTISGGGNQINNVIIGASTPLAGSFTTLSASGVATFSAGTVSAPAITTSGDTNTGIFFPAADTIAFTEGGTEAMRIDNNGNVGIGTSSPTNFTGYTTVDAYNGTTGAFYLVRNSTKTGQFVVDTNGVRAGARTNDFFALVTNDTERMRITSDGEVLTGRTTTSSTGGTAKLQTPSLTVEVGSDVTGSFWNRTDTNAAWVAQRFYVQGGLQGYIQVNTTSTTYSTSSDYRLKENVAPMTGALNKVSRLKPVTYKWKADGSDGQGFIAHELQAVVPECVSGEKDAVDKDGNPEYQGVDTSFLVATLTAAIQELNAKVEAQAAEIALLKSK